jgi:hypothetical protein
MAKPSPVTARLGFAMPRSIASHVGHVGPSDKLRQSQDTLRMHWVVYMNV